MPAAPWVELRGFHSDSVTSTVSHQPPRRATLLQRLSMGALHSSGPSRSVIPEQLEGCREL